LAIDKGKNDLRKHVKNSYVNSRKKLIKNKRRRKGLRRKGLSKNKRNRDSKQKERVKDYRKKGDSSTRLN
jgi:hypothetical protein